MESYNVKMINYPNGSSQIRKYSKPVKAKHDKEKYEMFSVQEEWILQKGGSVWKDNIEYVMNPFDKSIVPNTGFFKEDKTEASADSDIWHSLNRTKNKIYTYARCVNWEWFVTFTFSSEKTDRYNYDECSRLVRRWLNNQRRNAPDLFYLVVPEQHKDGAWHFHGLLANTGKMKFSDSGKKDRTGKSVYNMNKWSNGFTTATAVADVYSVSKYIGKYITKELCEITRGKQRYFVSQNIPKPDETVFLIDENIEDFREFMTILTDSLDCEIVHISTPKNDNAFVGVEYYELQNRIDKK